MTKSSTRFLIVFILMLLGAGLVYYFFRSDSYGVRGFSGSLISVEDSGILQVRGVFLGDLTKAPEDFLSKQDFSIKTDGTTVFDKSVVQFPTVEELEAMGGKFNLENLPRKDTLGSLEDLKKIISSQIGAIRIEAYFRSPIHNFKNETSNVSHVIYRVLLNPNPSIQ